MDGFSSLGYADVDVYAALHYSIQNHAYVDDAHHVDVSGLGLHASERAHDSLINEAILRQPLRQMPSKINRQALR